MSNIQKQHKISPAIAWLTIQKFIIFYCPLDGEHTRILIITFSGAFILEQAKKESFYFRYALKINQLDSKYQSNILIILMLFVIHFFALSYIGTQIVEILPLDKTNSNYPYDIIWMARQNDEKYSEKIAEKYNGAVKHIPMIRATMFYSQEEIGISESTYKELTGKAYGLSGKEIVIGIEEQNYQREEKVTDKQAVYSDNTFD